MPHKARLKQGEARKRKKTEYRVTNARAYNLSLKKRGMISLYFPCGELKAQFINAKPYTRGVSGREPTYTAGYIELIYTFYRLFGWGMRQITGYMEDYWATRGLDIPVPSSGQLSERYRRAGGQRQAALRRAGQTARAWRGGKHDCRRHALKLRTSQSVIRTEVRSPSPCNYPLLFRASSYPS
jgi:hypothetical protein